MKSRWRSILPAEWWVRWACVLLVLLGAGSYFVGTWVQWNEVTTERACTFSMGTGGGVVHVGWWRHQVLGRPMSELEMVNSLGGEETGWRGSWRTVGFRPRRDGVEFSFWPRAEWRTDSNARERNLVATLRVPYVFLIACVLAEVYARRLWTWRAARRAEERRWRGHCPVCDYDLRGGGGRCPECGSEVGSAS